MANRNLLSKINITWAVIILALFGIVQVLLQTHVLSLYYESTLFTICINIMLAVSLNLVIGICGQFSLGHAGFMAIGAYCAGVTTKFIPTYWGMFLGVLIGFVISSIAALIVSIPTLRLKGDYLAIATLGAGEIIRILIQNMQITNGAAGLTGIPKLTTWPLLFFSMVITIIICTNFIHSAQGRACIAIREDEIAAEAMGVNTTKYKVMAFVVGALLASLAGSLFANYFFVLTPSLFTFNRSIDILVMVVFGGMGSVSATIVSAIAIGLLNMYLQQFTDLRMILYGAALALMMIFKPDGLLGTWEFSLRRFLERFRRKKERVNV